MVLTPYTFFFCVVNKRVLRVDDSLYSEEQDTFSEAPIPLLRVRKIKKRTRQRRRLRYVTQRTLGLFFNQKLRIINFNYGFDKSYIRSLYKLSLVFIRAFRVFKKLRDCHLLLCVVFSSMRFKDAGLVPYIIRKMFEPVHYSKHRMLYYFWRSLIFSVLPRFFFVYNVGGIKLEFHGKLGVGGNAKKRSYYYSRGLASNSTKFLKIDTASGQIKTATGVVGFTYSIFY